MTAVVMVTGVSGWIPMIGLAVTIAVGVLIPHLCAYKPAKETAKRIGGAVLLAVVLAAPAVVISCEDRCFAIECWWYCLANLTGEAK